jgi:hypothetical protein
MKKVRLNAGLFCRSSRVAESRRLIELPETARKKKFAWLERGSHWLLRLSGLYSALRGIDGVRALFAMFTGETYDTA